MASVRTRELTIQRTPRGFQQDVENAMGSDPIRAIVELVTNSDDAYSKIPGSRRGDIRIEVERRRKQHRKDETVVRVLDKALGMTPDEMVTKLTWEGGRTSAFEQGEDVRGLLGRGAKDIVHFGPVKFDSTRQGKRGILEFHYDVSPTGRATLYEQAAEKRTSHGTEVTLSIQPQFSFPLQEKLCNRLSRHFALRPILRDHNGRRVELVDKSQNRKDLLTYVPPQGRHIEVATEREIPGYSNQKVTVDLFEAADTLDDGEEREFWRHSLLVQSGRAAYEIFEGKFRRDPWSTYLGRLFGVAEVPGIRQLIQDYDDRIEKGERPDESNPVRLVRRDRSGLAEDHPFVKALSKVLEEVLAPHLERIQAEVEKSRDAPIKSDLAKKLKELGHLLSQLLREESAAGGLEGSGGDLPSLGLTAFPSTRIVPPGKPGAVLVRLRTADILPLDPAPEINVSVNHDSGETASERLALKDRGGYFSKSFQVMGRRDGEMTELIFEYMGSRVTCVVEWREPIVPPVEKLEFEYAHYGIKDGGSRAIKLLLPSHLVPSSAPTRLLAGSPNIFVPGGDWVFGYDQERATFAYVLDIRGRGVGSRAKLTAALDEQTAECELTVVASGAQGIVAINLNELDVPQRSYMSPDGGTLNVNAKDPSISRYLGSKRKAWPGQDQLHFRTMLAEIIALTMSRYVIQQRRLEGKMTASDLFREHSRLMDKWLTRVHAVLVPTSDLPRLS